MDWCYIMKTEDLSVVALVWTNVD